VNWTGRAEIPRPGETPAEAAERVALRDVLDAFLEAMAPSPEAIRARLIGSRLVAELKLGPEQSRLRAKLFDWHAVRSETVDAEGVSTLEVELTAQRWQELRGKEGLPAGCIRQKV